MLSLSQSDTTSDFRVSVLETAKPTLLIVDDEDGPRQSLKIVFKGDYNLLLANGGEAALGLLRDHQVHVAVLDIMMAGMSGIELLHRIKEIDPTIEIIMLTAYETIDTARQAVRYDACDYLNKPFDVTTIRAAVARAVLKHRKNVDLQETGQNLTLLQEQIRDQQLQEEMIRAKGEIYASVLHDISSPLTVISGFIDLINLSIQNAAIVDGEKLDIMRGDLNTISGEVARCFQISRRYLSFLRDDAGAIPQVGVNQMLADLRELLRRHPSANGHHLVIHDLPEETCAGINGTDLLQILLNLTINALQCSDQPHCVEVRCQRLIHPLDLSQFSDSDTERFINPEGFLNRAPLLGITIVDDGPGVPAHVMHRLFQGSFTTKPSDSGTGLGLSIVQRLIKGARGALRVQSTPRVGTTFTIFVQASR